MSRSRAPLARGHKHDQEEYRARILLGRKTYQELGPLTEDEMIKLRARLTDAARRNYISSIYGRYAGQVAWMEYLKWLKRQEGTAG